MTIPGRRMPWTEADFTAVVRPLASFTAQKQAKRTVGKETNTPTVKPHALMRYLCRLATPPDGVVMDPFMGSGSTGKAAKAEGFRFVGIDLDLESVETAKRRIV